MLSQYSVENFKAIGKPTTVRLAPITLLFGPNSAGKSSLLHSFLLLQHIALGGSPDTHRTAHGGEFVHLGGRRQYAHLGRADEETRWRFEWAGRFEAKQPKTLKFPALTAPFKTSLSVKGSQAEEERPGNYVEAPLLPRMPLTAEISVADSHGEILRYFNGTARLLPHPATYDVAEQVLSAIRAGTDEEPVLTDPHELLALLAEYFFENAIDPFYLVTDSLAGFSNFPLNVILHAHLVSPRLRDVLRLAHRFAKERGGDYRELLYICVGLVKPSDVDYWGMENSDVLGEFQEYWRSQVSEEGSGSLYDNRELREAVWTAGQANRFSPLILDLFAFTAELLDAAFKPARHVSYLGPLRAIPNPGGMLPTDRVEWDSVGGSEWNAIARDQKLRDALNHWLGPDRLRSGLQISVKRMFNEETLRAALEGASEEGVTNPEEFVASLGEDTKAIVLRDELRGHEVNIRNVGVGVSQVLPVLARALAGSARGSTHLIEQPELHLHPALQAELADVFIEGAYAPPRPGLGRLGGGSPWWKTFIIETHSEHLILRLLRRIRETTAKKAPQGFELRPSDVAVYYVDPTESGTRFLRMEISEDGDFITPWPHGFFPERLRELM